MKVKIASIRVGVLGIAKKEKLLELRFGVGNPK